MPHRIPLIDVQSTSAKRLVETLARHSCVLLENHGIDQHLKQRVLDSWDEFAAFPVETKRKVEWPGTGPWYGWQPVADAGPAADLMERFELRLDAKLAAGSREDWADTFSAWPDSPADFKPSWTQLYFELRDLASRVMQLIAEGLGRAGEDLQPWTAGQHANLVAIHYPIQKRAPEQGRWRAHPHTDIGAITLLWADHAPGGLEVAIDGGESWVPVWIPEHCWLLQVGELINLWSGDRIPANPHRVANPAFDSIQQARRSLVYFHHPSLDTLVTPPAGDGRPAITARAHIEQRQARDLTNEAPG